LLDCWLEVRIDIITTASDCYSRRAPALKYLEKLFPAIGQYFAEATLPVVPMPHSPKLGPGVAPHRMDLVALSWRVVACRGVSCRVVAWLAATPPPKSSRNFLFAVLL
jgi:hypothetical protein